MGGVRGRIVHARIVDRGVEKPRARRTCGGRTRTHPDLETRIDALHRAARGTGLLCTDFAESGCHHARPGSWARLQYRRLSAHYNAPRCKSQDLPPDEGYAFRAPSQGCNQSACAAAVAIKLNAALHPNPRELPHVRGC